MMRQLLDVVNQAVQIPLRVHLWLGSQREAVEPLVVPQVGEHRLDDGDAPRRRGFGPGSLSIARFMRSVEHSGERWPLSKKATWRIAVRSGYRRQRSRISQGTQSRFVPLNLWCRRPFTVQRCPLE